MGRSVVWLDSKEKFYNLPDTPPRRPTRRSQIGSASWDDDQRPFREKGNLRRDPTQSAMMTQERAAEVRRVQRKTQQLVTQGADHKALSTRIISKCTIEPGQRSVGDLCELISCCSAMLPFFAVLSFPQQREVTQLLVHRRFGRGDLVCKFGERGEFFYSIVTGAVHIKDPARGTKGVIIGSLESGQSFGELALLSNERRNADIVVASDVADLLLVDRDTFVRLFRGKYSRLQDVSVNFLLKNVKLFEDLPTSVANDFALHLVEARYKLGHTFTLDDSKCIYFIKEGTVCICARIELPAAERKDKPKFETIDLARLEKGAFFAESAVFEELRHGWAGKAQSDVECFQISKSAFVDHADKAIFRRVRDEGSFRTSYYAGRQGYDLGVMQANSTRSELRLLRSTHGKDSNSIAGGVGGPDQTDNHKLGRERGGGGGMVRRI
mmetsp:Transcript_22167/g.42291  ORF Transcript_22167/g.42291 Transcript_22167/m.42291 type:complete len:439 (+) Transcript_22167:446-1762(+)